MKLAIRIVQTLIGLIFVVFGINGFLNFLPAPDPIHPFFELLVTSNYIYVVKALEVVGGLLLLANRKVAFGLVLLGPVVVNILLYHVFLDTRGLGVGIGVFVLYWFVFCGYWHKFKGVLEGD